jgi:small subunit ribosomal protein S3
MGHKVNPRVFRIGTTAGWNSKWFAKKRGYGDLVRQDILIRKFLSAELKEAALDKIEIERSANAITIVVHSGKPGFIIGRAGTGAEAIKDKIKKKFFPRDKKAVVNLNIIEVSRPALSAAILVQSMIVDLEKRMPFRRVLKQAIERAEKGGAGGIKVWVSGRLNGAEIARSETLKSGKVPLHTLRADIDYARGAASTIYGKIGVKVWIYRGEVFNKK